MGHHPKVLIPFHKGYLQIILKFAKCGPPCEGRGNWTRAHGIGLGLMEWIRAHGIGVGLMEYSG